MLKTALIVDDSRLARLTLRRLLVKHNLEIFEAEGVVDAEEWLQRNTLPDVVFMDILMPKLDGYEGLRRMRENPETRNIPVVMYSGDISEEARQKARDAGATGYLPKPAEAGRLDHLINALNQKVTPKPEPEEIVEEMQVPEFNFTPSESFSSVPPKEDSRATESSFSGFSVHIGSSTPEGVDFAPKAAPESPSAFSSLASTLSTHEPISAPSRPAPDSSMKFETASSAFQSASAMESDAVRSLEKRLKTLEESIKRLPATGQDNGRVEQLEGRFQQRLNELEHRITTVERKPTSDSGNERQHRDIVFLQRQVADMEKKAHINLVIAIVAGVIAILSLVWHLFL